MDLKKIATPIGLLDKAYGPGTRAALIAHGGPYEFYHDNGRWALWRFPIDSVNPTHTIRVKHVPQVCVSYCYTADTLIASWTTLESAKNYAQGRPVFKVTFTDGRFTSAEEVQ
jgi:hypothetical protein